MAHQAPARRVGPKVACYDVPGVGDEPSAENFGPEAIAAHAARRARPSWLAALCSGPGRVRGGFRDLPCFLRPEAIQAVAFGHARLSTSLEGDTASLNPEVFAACLNLVRHDTRTFVRQLFKLTQGEQMHGGYGDELVKSYLSRVPADLLARSWGLSPRGRRLDWAGPTRPRCAAFARQARWMPALHR